MSGVVNILFVLLFFVCWFLIIKRFVSVKKQPVTVKATVYDKYKTNPVSRYPGTGGGSYVVVFKTDKGKLSFVVSEYSFENYRKNETGTLKYKGSKLISFD